MTADQEIMLIEKFQRGDNEAFDELFVFYQTRVLQLARQVMRQAESAGDVTQEVFLRAYQELPRWRGEARFSTWLHRTTLYVCSEKGRSEYRQRRIVERGLRRNMDLERESTPEVPAINKETRVLIEQSVKRLPPRQRAVFHLKQMCGLSFGEIAKRLEMTEGGTKANYHKALVSLREKLKELAPYTVCETVR